MYPNVLILNLKYCNKLTLRIAIYFVETLPVNYGTNIYSVSAIVRIVIQTTVQYFSGYYNWDYSVHLTHSKLHTLLLYL